MVEWSSLSLLPQSPRHSQRDDDGECVCVCVCVCVCGVGGVTVCLCICACVMPDMCMLDIPG